MRVTKQVEALLAADWADVPALEDVRVIATERALDDVQVPTVLLRVKALSRTPQAPLSHRNVELLATLISPHLDLDRAADDLEARLEAVLGYLDTRYRHDDASCVAYASRLAFDIPFTVQSAITESES